MTKEDIVHLSDLARIELSEDEIERLPHQIDTILEYVSEVQQIVEAGSVKALDIGVHYNMLRADEVLHEPGRETETLLQAAPRRQDNFLVVNKILQQDE